MASDRIRFNQLKFDEQHRYLRTLINDCSNEESDYLSNGPDENCILSNLVTKRKEDSDIEDVYDDDVRVAWEDDYNDGEISIGCEIKLETNHINNDARTSSHNNEMPIRTQIKLEEHKDIDDNYNMENNSEIDIRNEPVVDDLAQKNLYGSRSPSSNPQIQSKKVMSSLDSFKLFFDFNMCSIIIRETNRKANEIIAAKTSQIVWDPLTEEELDAYLGILITAGAHYLNNEDLSELWKQDSLPLFRASMSLLRFKTISRFIRFDNSQSRTLLLPTDNTAAISEIFLCLNTNLSRRYVPKNFVTYAEQLYPFRGRTKFTLYNPSKPAKYGIQVCWLYDLRNNYPIQGRICNGLKKPEIIDDYSSTKKMKCNTIDKCLAAYTCQRKTYRWTVAFFYNIINVATLAAYLTYMEQNIFPKNRTNSRKSFLKDLGRHLSMPAIQTRSNSGHVMQCFNVKSGIECMLGRPIYFPYKPVVPEHNDRDQSGRKRIVGKCFACLKATNKRKRNTRKACTTCNKPICDEHSITRTICSACA